MGMSCEVTLWYLGLHVGGFFSFKVLTVISVGVSYFYL